VSPDLRLALELADAADAISLGRFRAADLEVDAKPDLTPVTDADRAVEAALREAIGSARPGDGVLGEEYGQGGDTERRWIIDPIDGTRNFSRGVPVWATLIALEIAGETRLGVISAPALARRWWAERGAGAYANGERIKVSGVARSADAVVSFALEQPLPDLAGRVWHPRAFGDFWAHMLVAEGCVDGAIEAEGVAEWDLASVQVIVEEAGGRFSDFAGAARIDSGSAISSNGLLHAELLAAVTER
jgi:histidinol-phosphatase